MLKEENYPHLENIAELLWLSKFTGTQTLVKEEIEDKKNQEPNPTPEIEDEEVEEDEPSIESEMEEEQEDDLEVHTDNQENNTSSSKQKSAKAIQSPKKLALDHYREWERAFKFINLKRLSKSRYELDEEKTVENIASTKVFDLVFKRVEEKSFFLTLVIDQGETMELWKELIKNFEQMLMTMGVFSRISIYYWDTKKEKPILYVDKALKREASEKLVVIDGQRNLVWVMSDCIASSWKSGKAFKSIDRWSTKSFTSILQMFPKEMWMGTMLFKGKHIRLSSNSFNPINKKLQIKPSKRENDALKVPVISFDPYALQAWAKVVVNSKENSISGIELKDLDFEPIKTSPKKEITSEMRMQRFYSQASPTAQKLAFYMSVLPVDFQVTRILQEEKLPKSNQAHVAEVFLGGLIERTKKDKNVYYDFYPKIREELNANISADDSFEIMADMSNFVSSHLGIGFDFKALLADPNGAFDGDIEISSESLAYARLASRVLKRKGGGLYNIAKKIDKKINYTEKILEKYWEQIVENLLNNSLINVYGYDDDHGYEIHQNIWKYSQLLMIEEIYDAYEIKLLKVYKKMNNVYTLDISIYSDARIIIDDMFGEQHTLEVKYLIDAEFNEFEKINSVNLKEIYKITILEGTSHHKEERRRDNYEKIVLQKLRDNGWDVSTINERNSENNVTRYEFGILLRYKNIEIMYIEIADNPKLRIPYAKYFAKKEKVPFIFTSDGKEIYEYSLNTQKGKFIDTYPSPEKLYQKYNNEPTYWHLQLHPHDSSYTIEQVKEILSKNLIGLDFGENDGYYENSSLENWYSDTEDRKKYFLEIVKNDIVLIRHGAKPIALVKATSGYKYVESPTTAIWFKHQVEVEVLSYYDEYIKKDLVKPFSMPQTRGTLWKSKNANTDTYQIIDSWYKNVLNGDKNEYHDIHFSCEECSTKYYIDCDNLEWEQEEDYFDIYEEDSTHTEIITHIAIYNEDCDTCSNNMNITFISKEEYPLGIEKSRDVELDGVKDLEENCRLEYTFKYREPDDIPYSNFCN